MPFDPATLSENQQYGLAFKVQQLNQQVVERNARAAEYNANRPVSQPERPIVPEWTVDSYIADLVGQNANQAYEELVQYKNSIALTKFTAAAPEVQAQVLKLLEVPDVVA